MFHEKQALKKKYRRNIIVRLILGITVCEDMNLIEMAQNHVQL
jgi:hypothetical protein